MIIVKITFFIPLSFAVDGLWIKAEIYKFKND